MIFYIFSNIKKVNYIFAVFILITPLIVSAQTSISNEEKVWKTKEKIVDLMSDESFKTTEKIALALELLPGNFDFSSDDLLRNAKARVLGHNLQHYFPKRPHGRVVGLVFYRKSYGGWLKTTLENPVKPKRAKFAVKSYILYADGTEGDYFKSGTAGHISYTGGGHEYRHPREVKKKHLLDFEKSGKANQLNLRYEYEHSEYMERVSSAIATIKVLKVLDVEKKWSDSSYKLLTELDKYSTYCDNKAEVDNKLKELRRILEIK